MPFLFLILFSAFNFQFQQTETVDIKVVITNITSQEGLVRLGVFNNSKTFLDAGKEYKTQAKKPSGDSLKFYFKDIPKGDYAISLYHDLNTDDKCNLNLLLRPSEPYGFSNNVKLKLFKPNFEDCKIIADQNKTITIKLID